MINLDNIIENNFNSLVEKAISSNRIPIGYTCRYVPEVLLSVGNLFPVRLSAPQISGTEMADVYLSSVICSYTKSLLEYAIEGHYNFLGGFVFAAGCDHLRRLYDNMIYLIKPSFIHIIDVPHKRTESALSWYIYELKTLVKSMSSHFGININDDSLFSAIKNHNNFMELINKVSELRKKEKTPITGEIFHKLFLASHSVPKEMMIEHIEAYYNDVKDKESKTKHKARLMLIGSHLDNTNYIKIIESMGGIVVCDRFCTGSMPGITPIDINCDPFNAIAKHTFNNTLCPRMMEDFDLRVNKILELIKEFRIDGVVVELMKFCDIWGVEITPLISALRKSGIPVLRLEREYRLTGEGQLRTRVQAFMESIVK
ncbi:MAG: 2-hydroxyacyl-CoA dehydratase [Desulfobacterales bacterium]|nr:2-hydroxyacyl-CoA dehydratase [Desulfobacterales bacterium]